MRKLLMHELGRLSVEEFKELPKTPLVLILDNVRSALNVGSAFRTADAFAVEELALCGITAQPPHREILKTALGATESVSWRYFADTHEAITHYREKGYTVWAVEQTEPKILLSDASLPTHSKLGIIFGNEVEGVSEGVLAEVDACIEIPQLGTKHSLNVAVCVGIVTWELFKRFYS